jgi:hypothetical protein
MGIVGSQQLKPERWHETINIPVFFNELEALKPISNSQ